MGQSADKSGIQAAFDTCHAIGQRLKNIDISKTRRPFELDYETLLDRFYINLLELDELLEAKMPPEPPLMTNFLGLLRIGRDLDSLWDEYHSERLDREQFSERLKSVRFPGRDDIETAP